MEYHAAKPYQYEYEAPGEHGMHYKKEESDGHGNVKGSYGYFDDHGTFREVHYVADHNGFRAEIRTNEPGTKDQEHPHAQVFSFVEDEDSESSNHQELQKRSSHGDSDSKAPLQFQQFHHTGGNSMDSLAGHRLHLFKRTGEHGGHE
ncbi:uncharacterized protein CDAR_406951 [Caerostris darwini]|uniref:Uncharacterized protein n=1 Tax=Caerostris darwini TaxID=1538125 RepID=A0AAV4RCB0_9ARAC|nr:uncharacterized protein CDAR_406951 [Caerostris darwini]